MPAVKAHANAFVVNVVDNVRQITGIEGDRQFIALHADIQILMHILREINAVWMSGILIVPIYPERSALVMAHSERNSQRSMSDSRRNAFGKHPKHIGRAGIGGKIHIIVRLTQKMIANRSSNHE